MEDNNIPVFDVDGRISKKYMAYTEKEMQKIKERYEQDKSIEELWEKGINRIDIHQFEQNDRKMGITVNFFEGNDLAKVIEAGIKILKMEHRVFLIGYLKA